jgi:hypothetical protein
VPNVAAVFAEKETVAVQFVLQGVLPKLAVTPVGNTEAIEKARDMFVKETARIDDESLALPRTTERLFGKADKLKVKALTRYTVSERLVVWVTPPPTA